MSTSRSKIKGSEKFRQLQNYKYGDMVWAKLGNYPWWPGQIYNEVLAKPSVREEKKEGEILVSFFGDGSYQWLGNPAALIPFEENFYKMSRKTCSPDFQKAVDEAINDLSWRMSLGSSCQCRKRFIFPHQNVAGTVMVDGNDGKIWACAVNQIKRARDFFQPKDVLSFIRERALSPMNNKCTTLESVKHMAIVLEFRKALYVEYDETYEQAFRIVSALPLHYTPPTVANTSKVPLTAHELVIPQALNREKVSSKPTINKEKLLVESRAEKRKVTKRPIVELSHKYVAPVQNKRPKDVISIRNEKLVHHLHITDPSIGNPSRAPLSGQQMVIPQALEKAKKSLKPTRTKEDSRLGSRVVRSMATKSHVVELSRKNVVAIQNKKAEQNISVRVEKPAISLHATSPTTYNASQGCMSSQQLVIPQTLDKAKASLETKPKEKLVVESNAGTSTVTKRHVAELSDKNLAHVQKTMPEQDVIAREAKPVAATKVLKPTVSNLTYFVPKSALEGYDSVGSTRPQHVQFSSFSAATQARSLQFPSSPLSSTVQQHRASTNVDRDISQPMMDLLLRCSHIVRNVTNELGYRPYHPL